MAENKPKKTINYNGKDYDFYTLRENIYKNYDKYAQQFGYSRSKYDKDKIALAEILGRLENGEGTVYPDQITFTSDWGNQKGTFGKARNKSKHYRNPTWMIIDTLQGMDAYDPNAGLKKINENFIKQELLGKLNGIQNLSDVNKAKVQNQAIAEIMTKYGSGTLPEGYVLEEGFDLNSYINKIKDLQKALGTADDKDDDELAYHWLGIENPIKPKEEKKTNEAVTNFINDARALGITEAAQSDDALAQIYLNKIAPKLMDSLLKKYGIEPESSKATSSSSSTSGGVAAGNSIRTPSNNSQKSPSENPSNPSEKPVKKNTPPQYVGVEGVIKKYNLKPGAEFNYNGSGYRIAKDGTLAIFKNRLFRGRRDYTKDVPLSRNGSKLQYLSYIKKYGDGDKVGDGNGEVYMEDYSSDDMLSALPVLFSGIRKGHIGKVALGAQAVLQLVKLKKVYDQYKVGLIGKDVLQREIGQSLTLLGTQGVSELNSISKQKKFNTARASHNAKINEVNAAKVEQKKLSDAVTKAESELNTEKSRLEKNLADAKEALSKNPNDAALKTAATNAQNELNTFNAGTSSYHTNLNTAKDNLSNYKPQTASGQELLSEAYTGQLNKSASELENLRNYSNPWIWPTGGALSYTLGQYMGSLPDEKTSYLPYLYPSAKGIYGAFKNMPKSTEAILRIGEEPAAAAEAATTTEAAAAGTSKPSFWKRLNSAISAGKKEFNKAIIPAGLIAGGSAYSPEAQAQEIYPPFLPGYGPETGYDAVLDKANGFAPMFSHYPGYYEGMEANVYDPTMKNVLGTGTFRGYNENGQPVFRLPNGTDITTNVMLDNVDVIGKRRLPEKQNPIVRFTNKVWDALTSYPRVPAGATQVGYVPQMDMRERNITPENQLMIESPQNAIDTAVDFASVPFMIDPAMWAVKNPFMAAGAGAGLYGVTKLPQVIGKAADKTAEWLLNNTYNSEE